jgi:tRNA-Thr(GGU) m(6)t(6)A37 methyltransferase TsaA
MLKRLRRAFSPDPDGFPEMPDIVLQPIGYVRNAVKEPLPEGWADVVSRIVLRPELADALRGLDGYSHVIVLFWPHKVPEGVRGSKHQLHPRDDPENPLTGVLATRSQIRFNPVLTTPVPLLSVKGNVLKVRGLDAIDMTPVLDIKPYLPHFDSHPEAKVPEWITRLQERHQHGR